MRKDQPQEGLGMECSRRNCMCKGPEAKRNLGDSQSKSWPCTEVRGEAGIITPRLQDAGRFK